MIFISDHSIVVKVLIFHDVNGRHPFRSQVSDQIGNLFRYRMKSNLLSFFSLHDIFESANYIINSP